MATSIETLEQYCYALKAGKHNVRQRKKAGLDPHPAVLDEIINIYEFSQERIGEIDVPAKLIVGTQTSSRTLSFSADFMPLMKEKSEFAAKWRDVCSYHLSDTGIVEAPTAYEYLGKFYIIEGNKRVSVLRSFGAVLITLDVIRILPKKSKKPAVALYYEFLKYYKLSKLYSIQFSQKKYYKQFQHLLGFEDDHVWTRMERIRIVGFLGRLENHLNKFNIDTNRCDCLLALMEIYGYNNLIAMRDAELDHAITENKVRLLHGHGYYRIMCVADEEDFGLYSPYAKTELKNIDFLISCGDLKPEYLEFLVTMSNKPLFYIHGNHDNAYDTAPLGGCTCIDDDLYIYQGIRILGLGGSYRYSMDKYQYTEQQMEKRIRKLRHKIRKAGGIDIVVTHAPIKGYGDLPDYAHQGFECFEKLLYDYRPKLWLYGHVHLPYDYTLTRVIEQKGTRIINCYDKYEVKY